MRRFVKRHLCIIFLHFIYFNSNDLSQSVIKSGSILQKHKISKHTHSSLMKHVDPSLIVDPRQHKSTLIQRTHHLATSTSPDLAPASINSEARRRAALAPLLCITDSDSSRPGRESVSVHFAALHEPVPDECLRHGPEGCGGDHPGL